MNRLFYPMLVLAMAGGLVGPVSAQAVPKDAYADAWCGALFEITVGDTPANASPQQVELAGIFLEAAVILKERASEAHRQAGSTAARTKTFVDDTAGIVKAQVEANTLEFSFEECAERAGLQR